MSMPSNTNTTVTELESFFNEFVPLMTGYGATYKFSTVSTNNNQDSIKIYYRYNNTIAADIEVDVGTGLLDSYANILSRQRYKFDDPIDKLKSSRFVTIMNPTPTLIFEFVNMMKINRTDCKINLDILHMQRKIEDLSKFNALISIWSKYGLYEFTFNDITWQGGKPRRPSTAPKKATTTPKWIKTARKATVSGGRGKPPVKKTVYRNSKTGEQRVRKMATRPDGSKRVAYVKF